MLTAEIFPLTNLRIGDADMIVAPAAITPVDPTALQALSGARVEFMVVSMIALTAPTPEYAQSRYSARI